MANNDEANLTAWVDKRLGALQPSLQWQPNTVRALSQLQSRVVTSSKSNWTPVWAWSTVPIAAVALVIFLLVAPEPRVLAQRCVDCSIALWHGLTATSMVAPSVDLTPEQDRKPAIDFILNDAAGKPVRLSSYKGRVVLLNFWATWCGGCKTEMPWFVDLQNQFRGRGLNAIGVSMDEAGWKAVTPYLAGHAVNYTIVVGTEPLGAQYAVQAMPMTLLIDRKGKIAVTHVGLVTKSQYQSEIEALLDEKPSEKTAGRAAPRLRRLSNS
jgi:peroxiredoxin